MGISVQEFEWFLFSSHRLDDVLEKVELRLGVRGPAVEVLELLDPLSVLGEVLLQLLEREADYLVGFPEKE